MTVAETCSVTGLGAKRPSPRPPMYRLWIGQLNQNITVARSAFRTKAGEVLPGKLAYLFAHLCSRRVVGLNPITEHPYHRGAVAPFVDTKWVAPLRWPTDYDGTLGLPPAFCTPLLKSPWHREEFSHLAVVWLIPADIARIGNGE